jgi:putative polyhydroxyalkanoate system protein
MSKLRIEHAHTLSADETWSRLEALREHLLSKYGFDVRWVSRTEATFKRPGASARLQCQPGKVVISVELSIALSSMGTQVESRVRQELARALG